MGKNRQAKGEARQIEKQAGGAVLPSLPACSQVFALRAADFLPSTSLPSIPKLLHSLMPRIQGWPRMAAIPCLPSLPRMAVLAPWSQAA